MKSTPITIKSYSKQPLIVDTMPHTRRLRRQRGGEYPPVLNVPRNEFDTDFSYAIRTENIRALEAMVREKPDLIIEKIAVSKTPWGLIEYMYPIQFATIQNKLQSLQFLLTIVSKPILDEAGLDKEFRTALYIASQYGELEIARLLIEHGADVNKADKYGTTPLYIASYVGSLEIARLLIEHGADVNKADKNGTTPLYKASDAGYLHIVQVLLDHGADVNKADKNDTTPLYKASEQGYLRIVRVLLEHGAIITKKNINISKTPEIKAYLEAKDKGTKVKWKGFTKGDFEKFNTIFDPESPSAMSNVSVCPVCLKYIERREACNYMSHNCSTDGYYHEELYDKYKNASGIINWCIICARICKGHNHYPLTAPGAPVPSVIIGEDPYARDCRVDGGGGVEEKIARFRAMRERAVELQGKVNIIDHEDAMNELVEYMWSSPMYNYDNAVSKIKSEGKFNIPLNAFPVNTVEAPNTTIRGAPPGSFEAPEVLTGLENSITYNDSEPVIRFKHKNAGGIMTTHELVINKDSLLASLKASGDNQNRCFEPACNGYLWPEEIEQAFSHPLIAPSVTDDDRAKLASYKERFYRNYVGGRRHIGGSTSDVFQPVTNATCAVPKRPRGGRLATRKKRRDRNAGTRKTRR